MQKKIKIFTIAPPRVSGLDVLLPLIFQIAFEKGSLAEAKILIKSADLYASAMQIPEFKYIFERTKNEIFISSSKKNKLIKYVQITYKLMVYASKFECLILLHETDVSPIARTWKKIGQIFNIKIVRYAKGLTPKIDHAFQKKPARSTVSDLMLCFDKQHENHAKNALGYRTLKIGHPHLFASWKGLVADRVSQKRPIPPVHVQSIGVFTSSVVDHVYSEKELFEWCESVFKCITTYNPRLLVVIKNHPMNTRRQIYEIERLANRYIDYFSFSMANACTVAMSCTTTISPISTVAIDAALFNSKVIIYQPISEKWLNRHPSESFLKPYHFPHVHSENDLLLWLSTSARTRNHLSQYLQDRFNPGHGLYERLKNT